MFEIHEKLPFKDYCQLPGYHASGLKHALKSALQYQHNEAHGMPDSDKFRLGRAGHTMTLEPQRGLAEYVQWETTHEDGSKRIRSGKAWEQFKADNAGKTILTPDQFETACNMRDIVRDHPVAGPLVRGIGQNELSLRWTDKRSGATCKARPDRLTKSAIIDLKTTSDPDLRIFGNLAARFRYHMQAALYRDGVEACGLGRLPFKIIAIQDQAPFDVVVYDLGEDVLAQGQEEYQRAIDIVEICRERQEWPGMAVEHEISLVLPVWATASEEEITFNGEAVL